MRIALFGPPGAGKGTQAERLVKEHDLTHISTGDLLRAAMKNETEVGKKAKEYVTAGDLVPDEIVRELAEDAIAEHGYDDYVLDGYPRTVRQAEWLTSFLDEHDAPLDAVILIEVADEQIVERLSRRRVHKETGENYHLDHRPPPPDVHESLVIQREDDRPEAVRKRLEVYHDETSPVIDYYRGNDAFFEIDGVGNFETVFGRIEAVLEEATPAQVTDANMAY
ncbi:MAG: adenylate kinase [Bacteroidetes bacterium QS_8_64_10]|nr:MAG: adenylate kinase [Bacteroidetes bacterium QS_8_64_10]